MVSLFDNLYLLFWVHCLLEAKHPWEIKKDEYIIFLSDELLRESEEQIRYTIAHEIGHVILGHRNSIGKVQSKKEVEKQERQAREFVIKHLLS